ncbi:MAG: TIGR04002 family protein [Ruminococcus sp.]|nr:TIGR04002 family protein [Ruminococcus sp.]
MSTIAKKSAGEKVRLMSYAGVFAAITYVLTAHLHIPTGAGYTHAGDGAIFLAASILPTPYAAAAGAIGAGLADLLSGYAVWLPATVIIKALTAMFFSSKGSRILTRRNILAIVPALVLCVVGYSLYQGTIMSGGVSRESLAIGFAQTPAYCIQIAASTVLYVALGKGLEKAGIKGVKAKESK